MSVPDNMDGEDNRAVVMTKLGRPTELQEHKAVAQWLSYKPHILWTAVSPENSGKVGGRRKKQMGVARGVPDILIFTPPPGDTGYVGVAIEMKTKDGKMSDAQKVWQHRLGEVAWYAYVARGADEAIDKLISLGY